MSQTYRNRDDGREAGAASAAASREAGEMQSPDESQGRRRSAEAEVEVGIEDHAIEAPKFLKDWRLRAQARKVLT